MMQFSPCPSGSASSDEECHYARWLIKKEDKSMMTPWRLCQNNFLHYWPFVGRNPPANGRFPSQTVMLTFGDFFLVSLNMLCNKQSSFHHSCDNITVMHSFFVGQSHVERGTVTTNYVNTIFADALAPCIAMPPARMKLIMHSKHALIFYWSYQVCHF